MNPSGINSSILIVDDEPAILEVMERLLAAEGYDLALASSGAEALAKAAELTPDLVLLDVLMPHMDGFEVCRRLRGDPLLAEMPVIMVTALGDRKSRLQGLEVGADDFISKPFDEIELQAKVRTITRLNRYRRLLLEQTQRQQAEEALRESQKDYRSLFEGVPVGLYRTAPDGQILDANPTLVEMLGYPDRETLLALSAADGYVDAEERARWQALMDEQGVVRDFKVQWRRYDGTVIWVEESTRAVHHGQGQVLYYEGAVEDITERKQAEEALRESSRQLESQERFIARIVDSIPSSLVVIDRTLRIVSANRNFLEKARREAQSTLGRKIEEVFPQVLLKYTLLDQKVREVFRTGRPVEGGKLSYRAPGLPTRIYYHRFIPLKAEGAVENVMLLMDDITEQEQLGEEVRRAERHLASVVECANDLVISMDSQGHVVTWNQAAERTSGLKPEEVKRQSLVSLCAAGQQPVMAEMLRRLVRGEGVQNTEVNLLTVHGQEVPIAWSCSSMRDDAGKVIGTVAVGRDLTERRRLEAQLIHSAKMASLGVMAGGIAHEVRNPLGIISAGAQLLQEHPDDAQLRSQCTEKIYSATQRASLIIENLLKFARPQSEQMSELDLHTVLEETLALLAHQMTLQKVMLRKEIQPDLPRVHGNPALLQQVFTNLILNACNAMPQGGTLTVATRATEAREVEVRFADTGCGIPPENLPKMFVPFFTTMPVGRGTGLGLAISYSIVQQHRGTIEVDSQVGKGTTFTVWLPVIADSK